MKKTTLLDTLGSGNPELSARIVELDELLEPDPTEHEEQ